MIAIEAVVSVKNARTEMDISLDKSDEAVRAFEAGNIAESRRLATEAIKHFSNAFEELAKIGIDKLHDNSELN